MRLHLQPGNIITFFVGLLFIAIGIYGYVLMSRYLDVARETSGVVIEVLHESVNQRGRLHPVVRFHTAEGREIVGRSNEHHNVQRGATVELVYDARNPEAIEITTLDRLKKRRLLLTAFSVILGAVVCCLGVRQQLA
jgi:hypothetical protein